jgi:uncharacterized membrane protein
VLILGAVLVWATLDGSGTAWTVFAVTTAMLVIGAVVKYAIPHRGLRTNRVPTRSILLGGLLGIVGFFVIPVGLVLRVRARGVPRRGRPGQQGPGLALDEGGRPRGRPLDPRRARRRPVRRGHLVRRRRTDARPVSVLLALFSALAYGLSDFVGGMVSRRTAAWPVAVVAQLSSTLCTALIALFVAGSPTGQDFLWALLAGVASGTGTGFLYRGLAAGRMSVVAPVSGVGAALVPVLAGTLGGERLSLVVWIGIAAALPGIWLVSSTAEELPESGDVHPARASLAEGLLDGVLAGLGFGVCSALGQIRTGGLWPLTLTRPCRCRRWSSSPPSRRVVVPRPATWWAAASVPLSPRPGRSCWPRRAAT